MKVGISLESCVNQILENWNNAAGSCRGCLLNLVDDIPGFAYGDKNPMVVAVAQNPGGIEERSRTVGQNPIDSSLYFEAMARKAKEDDYRMYRVLQAMTEGTSFEDFSGLYFTNACKCHDYKRRSAVPAEVIYHCSPYLAEELSVSEPKLIVTFGRQAYDAVRLSLDLGGDKRSMEELHCRMIPSNNDVSNILVFSHWSMKLGDEYNTEISEAFATYKPG